MHSHYDERVQVAAEGRSPAVRTVEVVEVRHLRGAGCCNLSPVREVTTYYLGGEPLSERDPAPTENDNLLRRLDDWVPGDTDTAPLIRWAATVIRGTPTPPGPREEDAG